MATTRPFAYNTGTTIDGTTQFGNLAIGNSQVDYSVDYGGVKWWMGPDEDLGYVIAYENSGGNQPNPIGGSAYVQFWRTTSFTDELFLILINSLPARRGLSPFTNTYDGYSWLTTNGYWTTFIASTPTSTPSVTNTQTPSVTPTNTITPTVTTSVTPTNTVTPTITPTASVTPTNTVTPTETPTPTNTPTPSVTPTFTPTIPIPITGYGYNLVVLPYQPPTSGNTIFPMFATVGGGTSGTTNPNTFATNGVYWNVVDNSSVDRTSYFSGMTGNSVTVYFTQNGDTAIYSGSSSSFVYDTAVANNFNYNTNARPNQLVLIQSASGNFVTGQTVYISYTVNVSVTPTPTVTSTITSSVTPTNSVTPTITSTPTVTPTSSVTPTPTVTPTNTVTPTSSVTPTNTPTPTVTPTYSVTPTATPTGIVSSNLLLHYNTFNTSSYNGSGITITDLSGNGRNGTIAGSPTWTGNYFTFVDDYIVTPNLSAVITSANETHSVELWVYPTNNGVLVQYNDSTSPNTGYHHSAIEIVGGNLEVGLWNGSTVGSTGNIGAVSFNQWHQIVLTYNGSVCKGYIDGVYKGSVNVSWDSPMNKSMAFYMNFGFADDTNQGDGTNFDGRFGIMRVYNKALTDAEVLSNYNSTLSTFI